MAPGGNEFDTPALNPFKQATEEKFIGNEVAKELTHMAHGHEQSDGDCLWELGELGREGQRGKIGTNSIINKI